MNEKKKDFLDKEERVEDWYSIHSISHTHKMIHKLIYLYLAIVKMFLTRWSISDQRNHGNHSFRVVVNSYTCYATVINKSTLSKSV